MKYLGTFRRNATDDSSVGKELSLGLERYYLIYDGCPPHRYVGVGKMMPLPKQSKGITNLMSTRAIPKVFNEAFGYIQENGGVYPHHRGEHAFHLRATDEIWELTDQEAVRMIMLETC